MSKLNNFKGSIELISGITQKNNQDFPLIEAHAVQVDESGKRLDEALGSISIDDDTIVDAITSSQDWKDIVTKITNNETQNSKNKEEINKFSLSKEAGRRNIVKVKKEKETLNTELRPYEKIIKKPLQKVNK